MKFCRAHMLIEILCVISIAMCGCSAAQGSEAESVDKTAIESKSAAATMSLRENGSVPAFEDADMLYYIESVDGNDLIAYPIFRSIDEAGHLQPQIMFSDEDDSTEAVIVSDEPAVETMKIEHSSTAYEIEAGSQYDIVPGSIISVWGAYDDNGDVFIGDQVVVWNIV